MAAVEWKEQGLTEGAKKRSSDQKDGDLISLRCSVVLVVLDRMPVVTSAVMA